MVQKISEVFLWNKVFVCFFDLYILKNIIDRLVRKKIVKIFVLIMLVAMNGVTLYCSDNENNKLIEQNKEML